MIDLTQLDYTNNLIGPGIAWAVVILWDFVVVYFIDWILEVRRRGAP